MAVSKRKKHGRTLVTYAALQRTTVDIVAVQLADCRGSVLMRIHLHECKATVSLETSLKNIAEVLEERNQVVLGSIRSEVADIAGSLPLRSLLSHHVVALDAVSREVVVTERSGGSHAHGSHSLLLRDRRLTLLVGPVAADGTRAEPFTVHRSESLVSLSAIAESDKSVSTGATGLHVPHHTGFRYRTESREGLGQHLVVDFIAQVADEDVEVVRGILLVGAVGLVGPVDADFLQNSQNKARLTE